MEWDYSYRWTELRRLQKRVWRAGTAAIVLLFLVYITKFASLVFDHATHHDEFVEGYRVHGDCVFFSGFSKPTERLQHQTDTEDPQCARGLSRLQQSGRLSPVPARYLWQPQLRSTRSAIDCGAADWAESFSPGAESTRVDPVHHTTAD